MVRFIPSRVEGAVGVTEVAVYPDRLEFHGPAIDRTLLFQDIADHRPEDACVAERDWFQEPSNRFFRFYTSPPLVLYMPVDEPRGYEGSTFQRIEDTIYQGGFATADLG